MSDAESIRRLPKKATNTSFSPQDGQVEGETFFNIERERERERTVSPLQKRAGVIADLS